MKKIFIFSLTILCVLAVAAQGKLSGGDGSGYTSAELNTGTPIRTSVNKVDAIKEVTVYPNPAVNDVTFSLQHYPAQLTVYNSTGQLVYEGNITEQNYKMTVSNLDKGLYFYMVASGDIKTAGKLMVQ